MITGENITLSNGNALAYYSNCAEKLPSSTVIIGHRLNVTDAAKNPLTGQISSSVMPLICLVVGDGDFAALRDIADADHTRRIRFRTDIQRPYRH